jgi:hypothetical protein
MVSRRGLTLGVGVGGVSRICAMGAGGVMYRAASVAAGDWAAGAPATAQAAASVVRKERTGFIGPRLNR